MLTVNPWCCYFAAFLILAVPLDWLAAAVFAAAFHELCHIGVILLLGEQIHRIHLRPWGAALEATFSDVKKELAATLAGPAGSFCLIHLCHIWPNVAICAFIQGLFNLLPLYPLDGGRILRCLVSLAQEYFRRKIPCKGRANRVQ